MGCKCFQHTRRTAGNEETCMSRLTCGSWPWHRPKEYVYTLTQRGYAVNIKNSLYASVKSILRLFRIHSSIQLVAIIRSGRFVRKVKVKKVKVKKVKVKKVKVKKVNAKKVNVKKKVRVQVTC
jgi:hypothetical protein